VSKTYDIDAFDGTAMNASVLIGDRHLSPELGSFLSLETVNEDCKSSLVWLRPEDVRRLIEALQEWHGSIHDPNGGHR
jgi:hypothetical protein